MLQSNGVVTGNQWVVPYDLYLTRRYNAHINFETLCGSVRGVKYLFKYVSKGHDRAMMQIEGDQCDKVSQHEDYRCIGAGEGSCKYVTMMRLKTLP